jgi:tRNA U34 5-methylaminomethyl-2-thiouridine-forming methyltransferase MnmC
LTDFQTEFEEMHASDWGTNIQLSRNFEITKHQISLLDFVSDLRFDVVYFDAFEPETQPELWTEEVFSRLFEMMNFEGVLTTYCCKGYVRRNMISAGFVVEKVAGPPGKREMLVAKRTL